MISDEIVREPLITNAWRYHCWDCGYLTRIYPRKHAEKFQRIHRHRHQFGYIPNRWQPRRQGHDL